MARKVNTGKTSISSKGGKSKASTRDSSLKDCMHNLEEIKKTVAEAALQDSPQEQRTRMFFSLTMCADVIKEIHERLTSENITQNDSKTLKKCEWQAFSLKDYIQTFLDSTNQSSVYTINGVKVSVEHSKKASSESTEAYTMNYDDLWTATLEIGICGKQDSLKEYAKKKKR